jgi:2-methylisocitrate lyase-like PEP mutase family enzyme
MPIAKVNGPPFSEMSQAEVPRKTTRLKELFQSGQTQIMPLGALAIHAQMAERAGFPAFEVSGAMSSWWLNGLPDVGMVPRTEIIDNARRIVQAVDIPVFCDADTGYGGIQNVRRTVQDFANAGVAGIHIEDQVEPKRAGSRAGIMVVSEAEAVGRFAAAVDARDEIDADFVIVARTDAYSAPGGGIDEAIRRATVYREHTGVDAIMIEALASWDEARQALAEVRGPVYVTVTRRGGPAPSIAELSAMGQAIKLLPFITPGVQEVWKLLLEVRGSGETWPCDQYLENLYQVDGEEYVGAGDAFVRPTYEQIRSWEERYLPAEKQPVYDD